MDDRPLDLKPAACPGRSARCRQRWTFRRRAVRLYAPRGGRFGPFPAAAPRDRTGPL